MVVPSPMGTLHSLPLLSPCLMDFEMKSYGSVSLEYPLSISKWASCFSRLWLTSEFYNFCSPLRGIKLLNCSLISLILLTILRYHTAVWRELFPALIVSLELLMRKISFKVQSTSSTSDSYSTPSCTWLHAMVHDPLSSASQGLLLQKYILHVDPNCLQ